MKTNEIRKMTTEQIELKIKDMKAELFKLRMDQATGNLDKPHQIDEKRKTVARLKTILTEKENDGSKN